MKQLRKVLNLNTIHGTYWTSVRKPKVMACLKSLDADFKSRTTIIRIEKAINFLNNKIAIGSSFAWIVNHPKFSATQKDINKIAKTELWDEYCMKMFGEVRREMREFL